MFAITNSDNVAGVLSSALATFPPSILSELSTMHSTDQMGKSLVATTSTGSTATCYMSFDLSAHTWMVCVGAHLTTSYPVPGPTSSAPPPSTFHSFNFGLLFSAISNSGLLPTSTVTTPGVVPPGQAPTDVLVSLSAPAPAPSLTKAVPFGKYHLHLLEEAVFPLVDQLPRGQAQQPALVKLWYNITYGGTTICLPYNKIPLD